MKVDEMTPSMFYRSINRMLANARYPFRLVISRHFELFMRSHGEFQERDGAGEINDRTIGAYRGIPVKILDTRPTIVVDTF